MQNICPTLFSSTHEELLFRPVFNSPSCIIDYTFYRRIFIRHCFKFAHCQLGEIGEFKTRANKNRFTVCESYLHG